MELLSTLVSPSGMAVATILMGGIVVIVEAVRGSREAFWGDMFTEDLED